MELINKHDPNDPDYSVVCLSKIGAKCGMIPSRMYNGKFSYMYKLYALLMYGELLHNEELDFFKEFLRL